MYSRTSQCHTFTTEMWNKDMKLKTNAEKGPTDGSSIVWSERGTDELPDI